MSGAATKNPVNGTQHDIKRAKAVDLQLQKLEVVALLFLLEDSAVLAHEETVRPTGADCRYSLATL